MAVVLRQAMQQSSAAPCTVKTRNGSVLRGNTWNVQDDLLRLNGTTLAEFKIPFQDILEIQVSR